MPTLSMNPDTVTLMVLADQIQQAKAWLFAAEVTLKSLSVKRMPIPSVPEDEAGNVSLPPTPVAAGADASTAAPVQPVPASPPAVPTYRHKADILRDAALLQIPVAVTERILGKGHKPSHAAIASAEKMLDATREFKAHTGRDPDITFWQNF